MHAVNPNGPGAFFMTAGYSPINLEEKTLQTASSGGFFVVFLLQTSNIA